MLKIAMISLGPEVVLYDGVSHTGITVDHEEGTTFWVSYKNKKKVTYDLTIEARLAEGELMAVDINCSLSTKGDRSQPEKEFKLHLTQDAPIYTFKELE